MGRVIKHRVNSTSPQKNSLHKLLLGPVDDPHWSLMLHHSLAQLVNLHQGTVINVFQESPVVLFFPQVGQVHGSKVHRSLAQFYVFQVFVEEHATETEIITG